MAPITPLIRPREYFEHRSHYLTLGLLVFILYFLGLFVFVQESINLLIDQADGLSPRAGDAAHIWLRPLMFGVLVLSVIELLIMATVMHVGSSAEREGAFEDAIAVAGWSYGPRLVILPITFLYLQYYVSTLSFDSANIEEVVIALTLNGPSSAVMILLSMLGIAWIVYILADGVAGTHELPLSGTIGPALLIGGALFVLEILL